MLRVVVGLTRVSLLLAVLSVVSACQPTEPPEDSEATVQEEVAVPERPSRLYFFAAVPVDSVTDDNAAFGLPALVYKAGQFSRNSPGEEGLTVWLTREDGLIGVVSGNFKNPPRISLGEVQEALAVDPGDLSEVSGVYPSLFKLGETLLNTPDDQHVVALILAPVDFAQGELEQMAVAWEQIVQGSDALQHLCIVIREEDRGVFNATIPESLTETGAVLTTSLTSPRPECLTATP